MDVAQNHQTPGQLLQLSEYVRQILLAEAGPEEEQAFPKLPGNDAQIVNALQIQGVAGPVPVGEEVYAASGKQRTSRHPEGGCGDHTAWEDFALCHG